MAAPAPAAPAHRTRYLIGHEIVLAVILLVALVLLATQTDRFLTTGNLLNQGRLMAEVGLVALPMTFIIITGGIDLSVGSVLAVCGIVLGILMDNYDQPFWVGALGAIAAGILCGAFNGFLIAYLRLSSFVVTLGMLAIGRSLALAISDNKFFSKFGHDRDTLIAFGGGATFGIANPVIILVVLTILPMQTPKLARN